MAQTKQVSRRSFIRQITTTGAAGMTIPYFVPANVLAQSGKPGANDRIGIGLIGCGGMGRGNLKNCASSSDVVITGACDVWKSRRDAVVAQYQNTAKGYHDYREMLEAKDIDAVIIATPPHWHCRMAVDACRANKDIYLQKPMTLHLGESLAVRNAVRRHKRISQIGTQIHAGENYRRVVEFIRSGKLGKITVARTFNVMNQGPGGIGTAPNSDPPPEIDWDFWVGPGPARPFNPLIVRDAYTHCSFMDCSGGWTHPSFTMTWMMSLVNSFAFDFGRGRPARRLGIYLHGVNGTLYADYGMHEIVPEGDLLKDPTPPERSIPSSPGHEREWLDCIKSRLQPSCNADYHCRIDVPICLANLSMKLGRSIQFDPVAERIVGDSEASRLSVPEYRAPWKFPTEYV
jgi:hypothetical protein